MLYIRKQECNIYRVFQKFIYKLRNSFPKAFFKKCVLQKCSKYTGEHSYGSVISVKLHSNFIEIILPHGCFPLNLLHICRTAVLTNTYGGRLLQIFIQHVCHIFQYKFVSFSQYLTAMRTTPGFCLRFSNST